MCALPNLPPPEATPIARPPRAQLTGVDDLDNQGAAVLMGFQMHAVIERHVAQHRDGGGGVWGARRPSFSPGGDVVCFSQEKRKDVALPPVDGDEDARLYVARVVFFRFGSVHL